MASLPVWARAWRIILGFCLLTWAVAGGPSWGYAGVYFLLTGSFGFSIILGTLLGKTREQAP